MFQIDPATKRNWIPAGKHALTVSYFYDATRNVYRIISIGGAKVWKGEGAGRWGVGTRGGGADGGHAWSWSLPRWHAEPFWAGPSLPAGTLRPTGKVALSIPISAVIKVKLCPLRRPSSTALSPPT